MKGFLRFWERYGAAIVLLGCISTVIGLFVWASMSENIEQGDRTRTMGSKRR